MKEYLRALNLARSRVCTLDVIAFPKTQKAVDLMSDAPTAVTNQQLVDLHIKVVEAEG